MVIGVLALQGDFELHQKKFKELNVTSVQVRTRKDLSKCHGLVLPGGESATFIKLLKISNLYDLLPEFALKYPIFGTCAGLIALSSEVIGSSIQLLNLIDISVERNAYGRQRESFIDSVDLNLDGQSKIIEGVFIRAPKIIRVGNGVDKRGFRKGEVVIAESQNILVAAFHPELSSDNSIHQYYINKVKNIYSREA